MAIENISELTEPKSVYFPYPNIVAASDGMKAVCKRIGQAAKVKAALLVQGEVGTEKELIARTVHAQCMDRRSFFVRVECEHLTEARPLPPLFRQAANGTLYFNGIESLPQALQTELIRALDRQSYQPGTGEEFVPFAARIMAATPHPLDALVANGIFRHDLLHKLKGNSITVPPLRDRQEDIRIHVGLALRRVTRGKKKTPPIAPDALLILEGYAWPGNIPELEKAIRHAQCMARGGTITITDLPHEILARTKAGGSGRIGDLELNQFRGRVVKNFLMNQQREYKKLISEIEGFKT